MYPFNNHHQPARLDSEDLIFHGSRAPTLGVELELQIIDPETGDLAPGAQRILQSCRQIGGERVSEEFLLSMIEVKTGVCNDVWQVRHDLFPMLRYLQNLAGDLGYELMSSGTHPFARSSMKAIFPKQRYQCI